MDSQIKEVGLRCQDEMRKLGFHDIKFDTMGNTLGKIGNGPKIMVIMLVTRAVGRNGAR